MIIPNINVQGYSIEGERTEDIQRCRSKRNKEFVDFSKVHYCMSKKSNQSINQSIKTWTYSTSHLMN